MTLFSDRNIELEMKEKTMNSYDINIAYLKGNSLKNDKLIVENFDNSEEAIFTVLEPLDLNDDILYGNFRIVLTDYTNYAVTFSFKNKKDSYQK